MIERRRNPRIPSAPLAGADAQLIGALLAMPLLALAVGMVALIVLAVVRP